jgi:hypothetical protein
LRRKISPGAWAREDFARIGVMVPTLKKIEMAICTLEAHLETRSASTFEFSRDNLRQHGLA